MLNIALHSDILRPDMVPLATNIEYLTERIWSKVNSSFGSNKPKTVNAVVIAQLILSSQVNIVIKEKYEELQKRYKEDKIDEEEANEILASLKEARNLSQKLSSKSAESLVEFIDASVDDEIRKHNELKIKFHEVEEKLLSIENENDKLIQKNDLDKLEHLEEIEETRQYQEKKRKIQRNILPPAVLLFVLAGITGIINNFINNDLIKLIIDILNVIGFTGSIILVSILFIKMRLLEKKRSKDW